MTASMTLEARIARAFAMDDETWARHANPWSVYTRFTALPLLLLALWSHAWFGWGALVPIVLACAWIWFNPRIFDRPRSTDSWAARATFGERLWLDRKRLVVPRRHRGLPTLLGAFAGLGFVIAVWGALANALWPMLFGLLLSVAAKLWFCDRMVWLYEDMAAQEPRLKDWVR